VRVVFHHDGGGEDVVMAAHTLSEEQIAWFRAGSALNLLRSAG
jgi:aconitate hydratase